jgi:hypothetical protein
MNNVYSNFHKISWNISVKFVHPYNDSMTIYIIFWEVLGIITIIL